jgi:hypothetical protein
LSRVGVSLVIGVLHHAQLMLQRQQREHGENCTPSISVYQFSKIGPGA